jgi:molybdenum cofactor biosynthesis enzyme MoaA
MIDTYYELDPKDNHFQSVFVDVTHKCNMECANCYVPIRTVPDLDKEKFYDTLAQFPHKTEIRLIGGEPTVRTDLPEMISKIRSLGHRPTMMTNGLMLARPGYARELVDAGMRSIYISMNGADDDDVYEIMDGVRCADRKIKGWHECHDAKMNVNVGAILQKGANNHIPKRLLDISNQMGGGHIIRFRNVGQIGRFSLGKSQNWTWNEMVDLVCEQYNIDSAWARTHTTVSRTQNCGAAEEDSVIFFPVDETRKLRSSWIKITDWSPKKGGVPDPGSQRRGRLTPNFKVAPFFEHIKLNENVY